MFADDDQDDEEDAGDWDCHKEHDEGRHEQHPSKSERAKEKNTDVD